MWSRQRSVRFVGVGGWGFAALLVARVALGQADPSEELASGGTNGIVGGTAVGVCDWPSTVFLGNCTGTLIHPRVVTTAAHCSPRNGARIQFGEKSPWAFTITATKCVTSGQPGGPRDWAYCILPEDDRLKHVPIIPPIHGCEKDKFLKVGATLMAVGFGATSAAGSGVGTKRAVEVKVTAVGNGTVDVDGNAQHGLCHGDSGGPIFIHLLDGATDYGWRAVGSTTGLVGPGGECAAGTRFMSLDQHIAAIEKNENIDVTPCTDATGAWAPGPDCKDFPTNPVTAGGSWPACDPGPLSGPVESCGPSNGSGGTTIDAGSDASRDGSGGSTGAGGRGSGGSGGASNGGASTDGGTAGGAGTNGTTTGPTTSTGSGSSSSATTGTSGTTATSGSGGKATATTSGSGATTGTGYGSGPDDTGGCGCHVGARTSAWSRAVFALVAAGALARRRRRR